MLPGILCSECTLSGYKRSPIKRMSYIFLIKWDVIRFPTLFQVYFLLTFIVTSYIVKQARDENIEPHQLSLNPAKLPSTRQFFFFLHCFLFLLLLLFTAMPTWSYQYDFVNDENIWLRAIQSGVCKFSVLKRRNCLSLFVSLYVI